MGEPACGSELKLVEEKRVAAEGGDSFVEENKRMKMQEFKLVECFEEVVDSGCNLSQEEMSRVTKESAKINSDAAQLFRTSKETSPALVRCDAKVVDVNKKAGIGFNPPRGSMQSVVGGDRISLVKKDFRLSNVSCSTAKEVDVVTEKDVAYSSNSNPFYPCKKVSRVQCVEMSECGSVTGPPEPKDSLQVWKEMKQNGFLSSSHSQKVVTASPVKSRVRKTKADVMKKKMEQARIEQAKKEQVDRFTKIAAPSGLLNELNPGIINHVRNSKQVHSILKALVRPEGHDVRANKCVKGKRELDKSNNIGLGQHVCRENGLGSSLAHGRMTIGNPSVTYDSNNSIWVKDVGLQRLVDTEMGNQSSFTFPGCKNGDFIVSSSTRKLPVNASSVSTEDNQNSVSSLSVKAASVASQWLELLQQDIKGRLAALRRSKKRVRAVLQSELPLLLSNEFPSNQENEPNVVKSPTPDPQRSIAEMHETRWNSLFGQMDTTLIDEEQQLESWSDQVWDMQLLCDRGLYREHLGIPAHLQSLRGSESDLRLKMGNSDMESAVRAAAASIYSTCNFLMEKQNVACSQTR